ncbi:hypothetical protein [Vibrio breoganii]|uniref:hypothetical protein n=3 Tax=Vibrio TaxID=662 RepID=UPI000C82AACD|nr:hypothetical protein [Vibrio breoganii]PML12713.1 hypothetical protein BCT84_02190 [Vibrio breoganii]
MNKVILEGVIESIDRQVGSVDITVLTKVRIEVGAESSVSEMPVDCCLLGQHAYDQGLFEVDSVVSLKGVISFVKNDKGEWQQKVVVDDGGEMEVKPKGVPLTTTDTTEKPKQGLPIVEMASVSVEERMRKRGKLPKQREGSVDLTKLGGSQTQTQAPVSQSIPEPAAEQVAPQSVSEPVAEQSPPQYGEVPSATEADYEFGMQCTDEMSYSELSGGKAEREFNTNVPAPKSEAPAPKASNPKLKRAMGSMGDRYASTDPIEQTQEAFANAEPGIPVFVRQESNVQ